MTIVNINKLKKNIPNILTLSNLTAGIIAIKLMFSGLYNLAVIFIIIGMFLDYLDGTIARRLRATSDFGKELDSLSDMVTFGAAPALLCWTVFPLEYDWLGFVVLAFPVCGAFRLARYNLNKDESKCFKGLPITAAGVILALACLYNNYFSSIAAYSLLIVLSLSMISPIPFYSLKNINNAFSDSKIAYAFLAIVTVVFFFYPLILLVLLASHYLSNLFLYIIKAFAQRPYTDKVFKAFNHFWGTFL